MTDRDLLLDIYLTELPVESLLSLNGNAAVSRTPGISLPVFLPRTSAEYPSPPTTHQPTEGGNEGQDTMPSTVSIYDAGGALKIEQIKWDVCTFPLPVLPPLGATRTEKNQVLTRTILAIRNYGGEDTHWNTKAAVLESRFQLNSVGSKADQHLESMKNQQAIGVWDYRTERVLNGNFNNIAVPATLLLTPAFRQNARYIEIDIRCNPRAAWPECTLLPETSSYTALLKVPMDPNTGQVDGRINRQMILHMPVTLITWMIQHNFPVRFMNRSATTSTLSKTAFRSWFNKLYIP